MNIEQNLNISFKKIAPPTVSEIIEASADDIVNSIQKIEASEADSYNLVSKRILELLSPQEALSRALAVMSGTHVDLEQRSLIIGRAGLTTFQITGKFNQQIESLIPLLRVFNPFFDRHSKTPISNIRRMQNLTGYVFDVAEGLAEKFDSIASEISSNGFKLSRCKDLPQLQHFELRRSEPNSQQRFDNFSSRGPQSKNQDDFIENFGKFWNNNYSESRSRDRGNRQGQPFGARDFDFSRDRQMRFAAGDLWKSRGAFGLNPLSRPALESARSVAGTLAMPKRWRCPRNTALAAYSLAGLFWCLKN